MFMLSLSLLFRPPSTFHCKLVEIYFKDPASSQKISPISAFLSMSILHGMDTVPPQQSQALCIREQSSVSALLQLKEVDHS